MVLNCKEIQTILLEILEELREINDQSSLSKDPEPLLLPEEVCERLRISKSTLQSYRKKGLPHYQAGNRHFFKWSEILQYMKQHKKLF